MGILSRILEAQEEKLLLHHHMKLWSDFRP